jgi:gas vesicle protein
MTKMKQVNGVFLSFLLGGAVGGAIALLYAPKSGKHLRYDISRKANEMYEDGKRKTNDTWNDAKEKAEDIIESANNVLSTNVEKIVRTTETLKEALKSGIDAYNDERKYGNTHDGPSLKKDSIKAQKQST